MEKSKRKELLKELISLSRPIDEIIKGLSVSGFDTDPIIYISCEDISNILCKYIKGCINESDVEEWANSIEVREDIGYLRDEEDISRDIVYRIANPILNGELTVDVAKEMIGILKCA